MGGPIQLSRSILEKGSNNPKDLHNYDEMKLPNDSGQNGEEGPNPKRNGNALWPAM